MKELQIGLVGLPLSGKTTFFNLLTELDHQTGAGGKNEVLTGTADVPDERLLFLSKIYQPQRTVFAQIQFKDIPGVHPGDGAGRASKLLEEVRGADSLVQVVRAFDEDIVNGICGNPDPFRELGDFAADLILADMAAVENRLKRMEEARKPPKDAQAQAALLQRILYALEGEQRISELDFTRDERNLIAGQNFLTEKPLIIAVNVDEKHLSTGDYPGRDRILSYAEEHHLPVLEICARTEMEINQLPETEREEFMQDLNLTEPGIKRLARATYNYLGLISFFTVGADEVRAWTINKGTIARKAAGKVHSDMERGFIRAEVFNFEDIRAWGTAAVLKEKGLFRLEGKEYVVNDGDIITFRFNV